MIKPEFVIFVCDLLFETFFYCNEINIVYNEIINAPIKYHFFDYKIAIVKSLIANNN